MKYTYTVTDANRATASVEFTIKVNAAMSLADHSATFKQNDPIPGVGHSLPAATGGTAPLVYTLPVNPPPNLPDGLKFNFSTNSTTPLLTGTPTKVQPPTDYEYLVTDKNGATDAATVTIEITSALAWVTSTVANQTYRQNQAIATLTLPEATAGTQPYIYTLRPALPTGLEFDSDSSVRDITGTPATVQSPTTYSYEVTDNDGTTLPPLTFTIEVLSALALSGAIADQVYTQGATINPLSLPGATGGSPAYIFSLPGLPAGLTFNSSSRTLEGTPTNVQQPTQYTYRVTDQDGTTDATTFSIEVKASLSLPGSISNQVYTQNQTITPLTLPEAVGGLTPHTYTLTPPPPTGLEFVDTLRTLSGTPTQLQPATSYTYQVQDAAGKLQSLDFTIEVVAPGTLVLPPVDNLVYEYGEEVSYSLPTAQGGAGGHAYYLNPEHDLPSGLTYNGMLRVITGTAQQATLPRAFEYSVEDAAQQRIDQSFTIEVKMTLDSIPDKVYMVGQQIEPLVLPMSGGGSNPHTFSISPALPEGLVLDKATRKLTGTPTKGLPRTAYTYTVTDTDSLRVSEMFYIEVRLAVAPIDDKSYVVGEAIPTATLPEAVGGTGQHVYSLAPDPPTGLRFNAVNRTLTGTPTEVMGATRYTYAVEDAIGATGQQTFNISVKAGALQLRAVTDKHFLVGTEIQPIPLPAATGGLTPHQYRLSPAPPHGISFDSESRTLTGTPTAESLLTNYEYTVVDAAGETSSQMFGMQVHAALTLPSVSDRDFETGQQISPVQLPLATGGLGPLEYGLSPDPPAGLTFDEALRTLSGTPSAASTTRPTRTQPSTR